MNTKTNLFIKRIVLAFTIALSLLLLVGNLNAANISTDVQITKGNIANSDGVLTTKTGGYLELPIAKDDNLITLRGKMGESDKGKFGGLTLYFLNDDNKPVVSKKGKIASYLTMRIHGSKASGMEFPDTNIWTHSGIYTSGQFGHYYIRPNIRKLSKAGRKKAFEKWDSYPSASQHEFTLKLLSNKKGTTWVLIDGNVIGELSIAHMNKLRVRMLAGTTIYELNSSQSTKSPFLKLTVQKHSRVKEMQNAKLYFTDKSKLPEDFQSLNDTQENGIAVENLGAFINIGRNGHRSLFFGRRAADSLPGQRMFTVPKTTYDYAYILCALDNKYDKPYRSNEFTFRVTRYGNHGGNAVADSTVTIPKGQSPDSKIARRVGKVTYEDKEKPQTSFLWLIKVPIKNGLIQDLLHSDTRKDTWTGTHNYLDIDLLGPLYHSKEAEQFPPLMKKVKRDYRPLRPSKYGKRSKRKEDTLVGSSKPASSAHIFGILLHKSPAQMVVKSNIDIQAFYASDNPKFNAQLQADKPGKYFVSWEYADVDRKIVAQGKKSIELSSDKKDTVSIPVKVSNGWYAARIILKDSNDNTLVDYRTSFVMLPPDTRKAGLESPFIAGWWYKRHGGPDNMKQVAPLIKRLGIRHAKTYGFEKEVYKKYGIAQLVVPWIMPRMMDPYVLKHKMSLEDAIKKRESKIRSVVKKHPHVGWMLVFHENSARSAPFPREIFGLPTQKPTNKKKWEKNWPRRIKYLTAMSKMMRKQFPQIKMQYGNSWSSMPIVGELFREKFPRKYIDAIASESLGQTVMPERDRTGGIQDAWYLKKLARTFGYGDMPLTACTEWIGRSVEKLGLRAQAQWKTRDALLTLAYNYAAIPIAGIGNPSDGYYFSSWGDNAVTTRYPLIAPQPSYAAIATLTQVLDRAKYQRFVPTGSTVCYLEEFKKANHWVYALWTPRGERSVTLAFDKGATHKLVDMYGRASSIKGKKINLKASPSPQYIISNTKIKDVTVGKSAFPLDMAKRPQKPNAKIMLTSKDDIKLVNENRTISRIIKRTENWYTSYGPNNMKKMLSMSADNKNVSITQVDDPEMGKCIEVEFKPQRKLKLGETGYVYLKLTSKNRGRGKNVGILIKGNGGWGDVSIYGYPSYTWQPDSHYWDAEQALNFEGWSFLKFPYYRYREHTGAYPKAIIITFPGTTLVGTKRVPIKNQKVRIKSVEVW